MTEQQTLSMSLINDPNFSAQKLWKHKFDHSSGISAAKSPNDSSVLWCSLWQKACQFDDDASGKAQLCDTTTVLTQPPFSFREAAARAEIWKIYWDVRQTFLRGPHLIPPHVALNIWWHTKTQSLEENVLPRAEKLPASPQRCRCSSKSSRVSHVCRFIRKKEESAITRIGW